MDRLIIDYLGMSEVRWKEEQQIWSHIASTWNWNLLQQEILQMLTCRSGQNLIVFY